MEDYINTRYNIDTILGEETIEKLKASQDLASIFPSLVKNDKPRRNKKVIKVGDRER